MENRLDPESILIEINKTGIVAIHGDIGDAPFLNLIAPALMHLDRTIQDLNSFTTSEAFQRVVDNAATEMESIEQAQSV